MQMSHWLLAAPCSSPKPRFGACRLAASDRADAEVSDEAVALPEPRSSGTLTDFA